MATAMTYNDSEFLFRLQTQIIDGGTNVLRNIFDQKLHNIPLGVFLANEKKSIKRLRAQKAITKTQYNLLYPPTGQPSNSANFDITLIICLLRNLQSLGLNQNFNWNAHPQPSDTSLEAELYRLKGFRNEIAHISSTKGFQQASFLTKWTDIEQVLLRLNTAVPNPVLDLQQTLDSYKNSPLEPVAEQRIQADIKLWKKSEKALEIEMHLIKTDVKSVTGRVKLLTQNVKDMNMDVKEVRNKAREANENVEKMTQDVMNVKGIITELKEQGGEVKKEVKTVKKGFHSLKGNIREVKQYAEQVQANVKEINDDVAEVKGNIQKVKEDVRKEVEEITNSKETKERDKIKDLQEDLISFYRDQHCAISLSPLITKDAPLLEFYVQPDIYSVHNTLSGVKQKKTAVKPLRNVFYNDNKLCRKIYLTADAGLGKTALSKRLALTWCHATKPLANEGQYFSQEEIEAINEFHFVFLLLLRNSSSECEIDDFIWNQIISQLAHDYTRGDLVNILCKERCLVILDGLDEWTHPLNSCKQGSSPIPHRKVRERTAVLTTTRPWKLNASGLSSSQVDKNLELVGLNQWSANVLKRSVISHMSNETNEKTLRHEVGEFTRALKEKQVVDLEAIPLLLMYLLFLWCNKIDLGKSQSDLYSQIIELLLSRTVKNYIELSPKVDLIKGDIPQYLSGNAHCLQFYTLLKALGQLAYQTLFREIKEEHTLVFDGSVAERYLNKDVNFCLKTGLITQSKVPVQGTLLKHESKVSFAHKTVQEFFAALYIHSTADQTSVPEIVLSKCKGIQDLLEMSIILKFICGMNVNVSFFISREMMKIINEDEITHKYRSSLESSTSRFGFSHPLKDFQDMCISCCKEIPHENDVRLCLQDVFIEGSCEQEQYRENLKQLTTRNKQNIMSLYIDMSYMRDTPYSSVQQVIEYFALADLENIEKIHYEGKYNDRDILPLLNKSAKCLYLSNSELGGSRSHLLCDKVTRLQKLEAIHISQFKLSHSELTLLYNYISKRHCMRQIELLGLRCTYHWKSCTGCLDLFQHSQLNMLTLGGAGRAIPVSELNINMTSLEKCRLVGLSNPNLVLRFINCVPADSKLKSFECRELKYPAAIETLLETLRLSVHVKHVELEKINLGSRKVLTSEMVNIEVVELCGLTMTASVLQGLVDVVQQQPQKVTIHIGDCDIKPESEFVTVKQKIKTSREHFSVLCDIWGSFVFEKIKQGD